ncbi:MAG: transposase [Dactylosporangium sp.]|nr:hypothetical protein [Dactylosporangium sp.]NNJ62354.1 transposase [Dactylosporangium sp.]
MTPRGLPELDVARVRRCCADRVPEHAHDQIRVECDVTDRHLTIVECRPPWNPELIGPEWTRLPIARLAYTKSRRTWQLHSRDRNAGRPTPAAPGTVATPREGTPGHAAR